METLEEKAQAVADGLAISVYIREGKIYQHGPGLEIRPREGAKPIPHEIDILKGDTSKGEPAP
jgi:hypothetical protein